MTWKCSPDDLLRLVDNFPRARVLVIGDLILDRYLRGKVERISPEAPVPVVHIRDEEERAGGAANVAANVARLEARVDLIGLVGHDSHGDHLLSILKSIGCSDTHVLRSKGRPTTTKTRIMAQTQGQSQQMLRIDSEDSRELTSEETNHLLQSLNRLSDPFHAVVVEDYGKGVITRQVVEAVLEAAARQNPPAKVFADPCATRMERNRGIHYSTPNDRETARAMGREIHDEGDLERAALDLIDLLGSEGLLVTRAEHGMSLYRKTEDPYHIPTRAREVFDVSGAGDTAVAVFALAMAAGGTPEQAAHLANNAGGVVVGKLGTATLTREELRIACRREFSGEMDS